MIAGRTAFKGDDTSAPHDEALEEWQAGRLGTRHEEWEEGDHGGFCWKTLAICIAIVVVAFCAAEALL